MSMEDIRLLPNIVVQKLEEAGIPQNSFIFYQNGQWVFRMKQLPSTNNQLSSQPIDSLGPFDVHPVNITFILYPSTSQYTITQIGSRQLNESEQTTGIYAPIAEITLRGFARSTANIPDDATHFCWLYPPKNLFNNNELNINSSYEKNLLEIGGFAYFKMDQNNHNTLQLVRVNSLILPAMNGLTFEGPHSWQKEYTNKLWNQNRFQPVTLSSLREKGARYFAFINPYESLFSEDHQSSWAPSPNGAFVYLFNEDHSPHPFDCYFEVADDCLGATPSSEQLQQFSDCLISTNLYVNE